MEKVESKDGGGAGGSARNCCRHCGDPEMSDMLDCACEICLSQNFCSNACRDAEVNDRAVEFDERSPYRALPHLKFRHDDSAWHHWAVQKGVLLWKRYRGKKKATWQRVDVDEFCHFAVRYGGSTVDVPENYKLTFDVGNGKSVHRRGGKGECEEGGEGASASAPASASLGAVLVTTARLNVLPCDSSIFAQLMCFSPSTPAAEVALHCPYNHAPHAWVRYMQPHHVDALPFNIVLEQHFPSFRGFWFAWLPLAAVADAADPDAAVINTAPRAAMLLPPRMVGTDAPLVGHLGKLKRLFCAAYHRLESDMDANDAKHGDADDGDITDIAEDDSAGLSRALTSLETRLCKLFVDPEVYRRALYAFTHPANSDGFGSYAKPPNARAVLEDNVRYRELMSMQRDGHDTTYLKEFCRLVGRGNIYFR